MAEMISRKQFLRTTLFQTARVSADLAQVFLPDLDNRQGLTSYPFAADFTPESLIEEAKKLGLDPKDKEAVLAAVYEKLQPPETQR